MRFRYTGQQLLAPLNLYYYKARIYSPTLGRFLQTDPIGQKDDMNLYAYVGNNSINSVDPTGMYAGKLTNNIDNYVSNIIDPPQTKFNISNVILNPELGGITPLYPESYLPVFSPVRTGVRVGEGVSNILPKPPTGKGSVNPSQRDPQRTFSSTDREIKRSEQGGMCGNGCGTKIDKDNSHGHHVIRHADGGATKTVNHVEVCISCHKDLHSK